MDQQAYDIRRARGHVLSGLKAFYPNGVSDGLLYRDVLLPVFGSMEWVEAFQVLQYLKDAGYIELVQMAGPQRQSSAKERLYRLTTRGYDVALGITKEPSIEMEP